MKIKQIFILLVLLSWIGQIPVFAAKTSRKSNWHDFTLKASNASKSKMRAGWNGKRLVVKIVPENGEGEHHLAKRVLNTKYQNIKTVRKYNKARRLYRNRSITFPMKVINGQVRTAAFKSVFYKDTAGINGWQHRVTYSWETTSMIAGLFTKSGIKAWHLVKHNKMNKKGNLLKKGDLIEIPWKWISPVLSLRQIQVKAPLKLKQDSSGKLFAHYQMKPGEALYSSVVVRFTGRMLNDEVNQLSRELLKINNIKDARKIQSRQKIKIPLDWLSEEYLLDPSNPEITEQIPKIAQKKAKSKKEKKLKKATASSKKIKKKKKPKAAKKLVKNNRKPKQSNTSRIHVILDPGHGGGDPGAIAGSKRTKDLIYEDEVVYDISQRLTGMLKRQGVVVHLTLEDPNQRKPVRYLTNRHDEDERLLVTPKFLPRQARKGVNMRVYLVNAIYHKLRRQKVPSENIIFISMHGDALHPSLGGAMVYYPDHRLRRPSFGLKSRVYRKRKEYNPEFRYNARDNRYSAKLSRSFGKTIIDEFTKKRLRTHRVSSAVRGYLYRRGKKTLPGVLRYSKVPTSVLIEVANLNNKKDRKNLLRSSVRQKMAQAITSSIAKHYGRPSALVAQR